MISNPTDALAGTRISHKMRPRKEANHLPPSGDSLNVLCCRRSFKFHSKDENSAVVVEARGAQRSSVLYLSGTQNNDKGQGTAGLFETLLYALWLC